MAMSNPRLHACVLREFGITALMPEGERQDAHERAIAVGVLVGPPCVDGGFACTEPVQSMAGLDAGVEHSTVDRHVAVLIPAQQPFAEILDVQKIPIEQTGEQAKGLSSVIAE